MIRIRVGLIPHELGELAILNLLDLSKNNLTSMIPTSIATRCLNLTNLDLSSIRLNGEIPPELGTDSNAQGCKVARNQLDRPDTRYSRTSSTSHGSDCGTQSTNRKDIS